MAASTKPQVLTTTVSASAGSSTSTEAVGLEPAGQLLGVDLVAGAARGSPGRRTAGAGSSAGSVRVVVMIVSSMPARPPARHASRSGRSTGVTAHGRQLSDREGVLGGLAVARPAAPRSWPSTLTVERRRRRTGRAPAGDDLAASWLSPKARSPLKTTLAGAVADDDVGAARRRRSAPPAPGRRAGWTLLVGPPEPLRTGAAARSSTGLSITSRAIDQASTSAITAATSTDQFGPPRVPRMRAAGAGGQLGLEDPARVDRARRRTARRTTRAAAPRRRRAPGPGCAGGRGRRSRRRRARSRRPRSTRSRAAGSGCARPAGRRVSPSRVRAAASSGPITGSSAGSTAKSSMHQRLDRRARRGRSGGPGRPRPGCPRPG